MDIIDFILEKQGDLGCSRLTRKDLEEPVAEGTTIIDEFDAGFAVVNPERRPGYPTPKSHLWLIWLRPEFRGKGLGKTIVRELIERYSPTYQMTLICHGAARAKFFGRCGFKVTERDGEWRTMETWR
jgi:GNAT superfamily N-acetyltransferase